MKGVSNGRLFSALLQAIIILIYLQVISAELFHLHRDPGIGNRQQKINHNRVTSYDQCKVRGVHSRQCACHTIYIYIYSCVSVPIAWAKNSEKHPEILPVAGREAPGRKSKFKQTILRLGSTRIQLEVWQIN